MQENIKINNSLERLKSFIEGEAYKGFDPYDALKSPLFNLPVLNNARSFRFLFQQLLKRLPFNIRTLLSIKKGYNPVTLGLSIQAYAYLFQSENNKRNYYLEKIDFLVGELKKLVPESYHGACWGYDFDWEARDASIPAFQPTVVATGIISNALFIAHIITGHKTSANLVKSAADFVTMDLNRTYKGKYLCFSYSPFDNQQVFNASLKGARILAQAYSLEQKMDLKNIAIQALNFV
ncbi:delta-aminolevulinic acid dehydratase, partial [Bacteroidota bacterium]